MGILDSILPKVIFEAPSEINQKVTVIQIGKTRKLLIKNFLQSVNFDSPYARKGYWKKLSQLVRKRAPEAKNILVLGLGAATLQRFLAEAYDGLSILSVEIDPLIVEVAEKYFALSEIPNHKTIVADSFKFLGNPESFGVEKGAFDVIIADTYDGCFFGKIEDKSGFFNNLKANCVDSGLVTLNMSFLKKTREEETGRFMVEFGKHFRDVGYEWLGNAAIADNVFIYGRA